MHANRFGNRFWCFGSNLGSSWDLNWNHLRLKAQRSAPHASQDALGSENPPRSFPGLDFDKLLIDLLLFVEDEYLSYKLHRVDNILMCSNLKGLCGVVRYYKYINANETNNFFEYFDFEQQQNIQIDSSCLQHCIQNVNEKLNTFFRN